MALVLKNRVKETSLTSGSGTVALDGAVAGYQSFSGVMTSGDTTYYTIVNGDNWEVGLGTYSPNSLSRDTIFSSSTGSKISLSGQSYVFIVYPSEKSVYRNADDQIVVTGSGIRFNDGTIQLTAASGVGGDSYTAGTGLQLSGSEFSIDSTVVQSGDNISVLTNDIGYLTSHPAITAASSSNNNGRTYIQDILLDSNGHITGITTATETVVDTDTTYSAGTGLQLSGNTFSVDSSVIRSGNNISLLNNNSNYTTSGSNVGQFVNDVGYLTSHPAVSSASSSNNSGRTYIQDILLDSNGHITGIATATETVTDTTYSAGTGLQLNGTVFSVDSSVLRSGQNVSLLSNDAGYLTSHPTISAASSSNNSNRTYIQDILLDNNGHVTGISTATETVVDTDTTYSAGSGLQLAGTTFSIDETVAVSGDNITIFTNNAGYLTSHPAISAASSSNNSGRTYVQDILLDSNGHVTGVSTATETVVDTDTTYSAGTGLQLSGTTFSVDSSVARSGNNISIFTNNAGYLTSHPTISAASSSNNSGRTYIQDVILDSNGHVTGIQTATETVTDTTYSAGSGLILNGTTFHTHGSGTFSCVVIDEEIPNNIDSTIFSSGGSLFFGNSELTPTFKPVRPWFKDSTIGYGPAGGGAGTYTQSSAVLIAYSINMPACTINTIRLVVKTAGAAGSKFRVGIAYPHFDNRPGDLIRDFGTVSADSTGQKSISLETPLSLSLGWYYIFIQKEGSGSAGVSATSWTFSDGMMGHYYISATPEIHPITWWYLQNQNAAFQPTYESSGWLPQVSTATPRVILHP